MNWEGDLPSELTILPTDKGKQVEYTKALERPVSKELDKMTLYEQSWVHYLIKAKSKPINLENIRTSIQLKFNLNS